MSHDNGHSKPANGATRLPIVHSKDGKDSKDSKSGDKNSDAAKDEKNKDSGKSGESKSGDKSDGKSGKDLILALGGLFLIYKATHEIHASLEGEEGEATTKVMANFAAVVTQIALINLVFSIDSIVTAVGMANEIWVMAVAVILSMVVLMLASGPVAEFVERHPTVKVLALGFLIMIGMALVADSFGAHVPKGYIYSAMVFSVCIEGINMLRRHRARPVHLRNPYGPGEAG